MLNKCNIQITKKMLLKNHTKLSAVTAYLHCIKCNKTAVTIYCFFSNAESAIDLYNYCISNAKLCIIVSIFFFIADFANLLIILY